MHGVGPHTRLRERTSCTLGLTTAPELSDASCNHWPTGCWPRPDTSCRRHILRPRPSFNRTPSREWPMPRSWKSHGRRDRRQWRWRRALRAKIKCSDLVQRQPLTPAWTGLHRVPSRGSSAAAACDVRRTLTLSSPTRLLSAGSGFESLAAHPVSPGLSPTSARGQRRLEPDQVFKTCSALRDLVRRPAVSHIRRGLRRAREHRHPAPGSWARAR